MSIILKCDRCGKAYEYKNLNSPSGIIFEKRDFNVNPKNYIPFNKLRMDLCPDCLKKIQKFLGELNIDTKTEENNEIILEGMVLETGVENLNHVIFPVKNCIISFSNPVPVMLDYGRDVLGRAEIFYKGKDLFGRFYVKKNLLEDIFNLDDGYEKIYVDASFSDIESDIFSDFTINLKDSDSVNIVKFADLESVSILLNRGSNTNHFVRIVK